MARAKKDDLDLSLFGITADEPAPQTSLYADDFGELSDDEIAAEYPHLELSELDDEELSLDDEVAAALGIRAPDVGRIVEQISQGPTTPAKATPRGPSQFSTSQFDQIAAKLKEQELAASEKTRDAASLTKEERKAYIESLGDSLELYPHLLAIKPREGYLFHSDYFEVDGGVGCILAYFHRDEAVDEFNSFWGVDRIPDNLPDGVRAVLIDTFERQTDKWVDDAQSRANKLDELSAKEQLEGGSIGGRRKTAKTSDDIHEVIAELLDGGASYLLVQMRMMIFAPSVTLMDTTVENLSRQYIEKMSSVILEPYHGEQRVELSTLWDKPTNKRAPGGRPMGFTSTEFAGAYSLVTNGLADPGGEYVGDMEGDYNNSAILFDVNRWDSRVVLANETRHDRVGGRVVDMWGSKISQAALLENNRVVHLILNDADMDVLGPPLTRITAKLDMTHGEINMFEVFGDKADEIGLYNIQQRKLVLMAEQVLEQPDQQSISIIRNELRSMLTLFYTAQRMWTIAPENNRDKLRLVGLDHTEVPRLRTFVPWVTSEYEAKRRNQAPDLELMTLKILSGVFENMLDSASDLFDKFTSDEIDVARNAQRVIYNFADLVHRGAGLAMAQLVNSVGFAISDLKDGDVVIIHGADQITDTQVQDYIDTHLDRLIDRGGRVAFLYDKPENMLATRHFNRLERADYTILGPMVPAIVAQYQDVMRTSIPEDLQRLLAMRGYPISYLRRGGTNVVFTTALSLGLPESKKAPMPSAHTDVAAKVTAERISENAGQALSEVEASQVVAQQAQSAKLRERRVVTPTPAKETKPGLPSRRRGGAV